MTEEEYFRKTYPDFCYGDKPLSPYWDLFQYGTEFGERQSEKKIEELEQKLEQTEKDLADYQFNYPSIKELSKENAELKKKCYKKAVKDYCELEKENAGLKARLNAINLLTPELEKMSKAKTQQLAQAKEILQRVAKSVYLEEYNDAKYDAEQFLTKVK